ncbi:hypothetical protein [Thermogemmatispora tikiterensis]|uniref:Uncharacterized protein n=1 Tax=Thermogemmatispora tikiterensis TaxID=1825093 RepID=A0A328VKI7_9CHLR|nr:hypothetical protein [Thermogemmatispora tikiterensis]RAQ97957.1 hypothetical protein A4R35_20630 [Thermogemmatispora tikiterensis]
MITVLLAVDGTLIVMAILTAGRLGFGRREPFETRRFLRWFGGYFFFNLLFCFLLVYFNLPALTGPLGGWQWVLWPLAISSLANLFSLVRPIFGAREEIVAGAGRRSAAGRSGARQEETAGQSQAISRGNVAAGLFGLVVVGIVGLVVSGLIVVFTTWFDSNAKALAAIPQIKAANSPTLPPTDPNHIVLVSPGVAAYEGQQVLGATGQNLGSTYNLDPNSYTLQSINHHLYYVAPLTYNNIFVNLSNAHTPGFVVVDAENPEATPRLMTGGDKTLAYLPGALLNQDLLRHVYLSGYTYGRLVDPTLELDDQYHPYWTISLMQPSRGYTGDVLSEVLLVDAHTGQITRYRPQDVPSWVDRVMPAATVTQYLQWWGLYHAAPWFNPSGANQQVPASEPQLLYNSVDQPVWLVPMTSSSLNDNSSTGIVLFDTHANRGTFYPLTGIGIGSNVENTIQSTRANLRSYDVDSVQLYQLYGEPTWVAIFVQHVSSGSIFQAVGIVDARNLNGSNVQYDTTLSGALQDYQQWLTQQASATKRPTSGTVKAVVGRVVRVASVQEGSNTVFYLQLADQPYIFTANLSLSPKLPLVQPGDVVKGDYYDSGGQVMVFKTFDDLSVHLAGPTETPSPTASPPVTSTSPPVSTSTPSAGH